jgi:hypothetical protein
MRFDMRKIFLVLSFALFYVNEINGQAAVDIPLQATENNNPPVFELAVGLDLTATNCIDPQLGEYQGGCIPLPPCIIFDLDPYGCPSTTSFKDYRPPGNPPAFPFTGTIEHTLIWQRSQGGTSINIEYNIPYGAQMRITDQIGGWLLNIGPFTGTGVAVIPGTYVFQSAYLFMDYTDIVPVELTSFTALVLENEKVVQLNWKTATETNNSGFEIERQVGSGQSAVGNWNSIGFVPGFGTTSEPKSYSFTDDLSHTPNLTHTLRYRLKQIDFDGTFTYSNDTEVEIDFTPMEFLLYQNYPNPFNPNTVVKFEIPSVTLRQAQSDIMVTLKVYDVLGNEVVTLVNEGKLPGIYEVEFDASSLVSGVYLYSIRADNFFQSKKMILMK